MTRCGPENVRFLGSCDHTEISRLMTEARVVAVPSIWYENLPLAALEAAAAGRAVLGHEVGSMPEAVDHGRTGFLSPLGDAEQMAARIREVMESRALATELGRAARKKAERDFNPQTHIERLLSLWEALIREKQ